MSYLQDNSSLRILNLSWNGFYLEGCRALVRTLQFNSTLEVLDLSNNRINRECLGHLVKGLAKNTTLHTLIVSHISHFSRTSDRDFCCFSLCEITHTVPACGKDKKRTAARPPYACLTSSRDIIVKVKRRHHVTSQQIQDFLEAFFKFVQYKMWY